MAGTNKLVRGNSGTYEDGNVEAGKDITETTGPHVGKGGKSRIHVGYVGNVETREDTTGTAEVRREAPVGMGRKSGARLEYVGNVETREDTTGTEWTRKGVIENSGTREEDAGNVDPREDVSGRSETREDVTWQVETCVDEAEHMSGEA